MLFSVLPRDIHLYILGFLPEYDGLWPLSLTCQYARGLVRQYIARLNEQLGIGPYVDARSSLCPGVHSAGKMLIKKKTLYEMAQKGHWMNIILTPGWRLYKNYIFAGAYDGEQWQIHDHMLKIGAKITMGNRDKIAEAMIKWGEFITRDFQIEHWLNSDIIIYAAGKYGRFNLLIRILAQYGDPEEHTIYPGVFSGDLPHYYVLTPGQKADLQNKILDNVVMEKLIQGAIDGNNLSLFKHIYEEYNDWYFGDYIEKICAHKRLNFAQYVLNKEGNLYQFILKAIENKCEVILRYTAQLAQRSFAHLVVHSLRPIRINLTEGIILLIIDLTSHSANYHEVIEEIKNNLIFSYQFDILFNLWSILDVNSVIISELSVNYAAGLKSAAGTELEPRPILTQANLYSGKPLIKLNGLEITINEPADYILALLAKRMTTRIDHAIDINTLCNSPWICDFIINNKNIASRPMPGITGPICAIEDKIINIINYDCGYVIHDTHTFGRLCEIIVQLYNVLKSEDNRLYNDGYVARLLGLNCTRYNHLIDFVMKLAADLGSDASFKYFGGYKSNGHICEDKNMEVIEYMENNGLRRYLGQN